MEAVGKKVVIGLLALLVGGILGYLLGRGESKGGPPLMRIRFMNATDKQVQVTSVLKTLPTPNAEMLKTRPTVVDAGKHFVDAPAAANQAVRSVTVDVTVKDGNPGSPPTDLLLTRTVDVSATGGQAFEILVLVHAKSGGGYELVAHGMWSDRLGGTVKAPP